MNITYLLILFVLVLAFVELKCVRAARSEVRLLVNEPSANKTKKRVDKLFKTTHAENDGVLALGVFARHSKTKCKKQQKAAAANSIHLVATVELGKDVFVECPLCKRNGSHGSHNSSSQIVFEHKRDAVQVQLISSVDSLRRVHVDQRLLALVIRDFRASDSGSYQCLHKANASKFQRTSVAFHLHAALPAHMGRELVFTASALAWMRTSYTRVHARRKTNLTHMRKVLEANQSTVEYLSVGGERWSLSKRIEWSAWSPCQLCNVPAIRSRTGKCLIRYNATSATRDTTANDHELNRTMAEYRSLGLNGWPCSLLVHFKHMLLRRVSTNLSSFKDLVQYDACHVNCNQTATEAQETSVCELIAFVCLN